MKLFILLCAAFFINTVAAQSTWTVQSAKNILLKAAKEDTTANVITIKRSKITSLVVSYAEPKRKDWSRYIMVYDLADNELISKETYSLSLSASALKIGLKRMARWKSIPSRGIQIQPLPLRLGEYICARLIFNSAAQTSLHRQSYLRHKE